MDYKELIRKLKCQGSITFDIYAISRDCKEAADAIETLLAELDAAMIDLRRMGCQVCKHLGNDSLNSPCCTCGDTDNNWQWRGPQKHD